MSQTPVSTKFHMPVQPVVMTIAGSDSGGGAGIQADLKTFAAHGAFGVSVLCAITAQNPEGVLAIQGVDTAVIDAQMEAISNYFEVGAAKTGMLGNTSTIQTVVEAYRNVAAPPNQGKGLPYLVVDPVMVSTSGARLLDEDAVEALVNWVFPLASVITPNTAEATLLSGRKISTPATLEACAKALYDRYGVAVLLKGGHLQGGAQVVDCLVTQAGCQRFDHPRVKGVNVHGTGCTLSAAIAANLCQGLALHQAVERAIAFVYQGLRHSVRLSKACFLNHHHPRITPAGHRHHRS